MSYPTGGWINLCYDSGIQNCKAVFLTSVVSVMQEAQAESARLQQLLSEERHLKAALDLNLQEMTEAKNAVAQVHLLLTAMPCYVGPSALICVSHLFTHRCLYSSCAACYTMTGDRCTYLYCASVLTATHRHRGRSCERRRSSSWSQSGCSSS